MKVEIATGRGVADRWRSQYYRDGIWSNTVSGNAEIVYDKLCALGQNPDIDVVAEIVGNQSWSYISCAFCPQWVTKAAVVSEQDGQFMCRECAVEALNALDAV